MELNKIYKIDAYKGMQKLGDNSIDLILTDPPYGIEAYSNGTMGGGVLADQSSFEATDWDTKPPDQKMIKEILRVSQEQIIFGGNYFANLLSNSSCWIVWDKDNGDNNFADCELAWTSFDTAVRKYTWKWQGMLQENMKDKEKRYHPTQKPVGLFKAILNDYSKKGDLILDPFIGSGTTGIVAKALGRNFIGFEKNKEYIEIAKNRLSNVQKELIR